MNEVFIVCWALVGQSWTCPPPMPNAQSAFALYEALPTADGVHLSTLWKAPEDKADATIADWKREHDSKPAGLGPAGGEPSVGSVALQSGEITVGSTTRPSLSGDNRRCPEGYTLVYRAPIGIKSLFNGVVSITDKPLCAMVLSPPLPEAGR